MANLEADLFGEDSDDSSPPRRQTPADRKQAYQQQQPARQLQSDRDEDSDDEGRARQQRPIGPPLQLGAELVDLPARDSIRLVRLSNILGLDTQPYDRNTYQPPESTYYTDDQGTRRVKLSNQLRWRYAKGDDGQAIRQSNARFVQWEDGSWQLLLGEDALDVTELDMTQDNSFLFVRHQGVIQGQAVLQTKVTLQPASLKSKLHTGLTAAVDKRHVKVNKVRHTATVSNPQKEKEMRAKAEEQRIRDRENLQRRQGREMRKYTAPQPRRSTGMTADYLEAVEAESDYDDEGMTPSDRARHFLSRDRLDEDAEAEAERRLGQAKRNAPSGRPSPAKKQRKAAPLSSDEELSDQDGSDAAGMEGQDLEGSDDDQQDEAARRESAQKPKARRGVIIEDDDDD